MCEEIWICVIDEFLFLCYMYTELVCMHACVFCLLCCFSKYNDCFVVRARRSCVFCLCLGLLNFVCYVVFRNTTIGLLFEHDDRSYSVYVWVYCWVYYCVCYLIVANNLSQAAILISYFLSPVDCNISSLYFFTLAQSSACCSSGFIINKRKGLIY